MSEAELLFATNDGSRVLDHQQEQLRAELEQYQADAVLTANMDELCDYFVAKFKIDVPNLREDEIEASQQDQQYDARRDRNGVIFDSSRPVWIPFTQLTFHVPYDGERDLFYVRASSFTMNPPRAIVMPTELEFSYTTADTNEAGRIKTEFERELGKVREHLEWLRRDFTPFNEGLRQQVRERLEARRAKLVADRGVVAGLGFKVRERTDAPRTYAVPTQRREVTRPRPPRGTGAPLDPALDTQTYERILEICSNMAVVLEQSPATFAALGEEDIRNHFLIQLNGQFQGNATGETFSAAGKTDILIKVNGRSVFIAECKFWNGPKSAQEALDQLLTYATWRDSKLALFIFSRGGSFTEVLRKLEQAIAAHGAGEAPRWCSRELRLSLPTGPAGRPRARAHADRARLCCPSRRDEEADGVGVAVAVSARVITAHLSS